MPSIVEVDDPDSAHPPQMHPPIPSGIAVVPSNAALSSGDHGSSVKSRPSSAGHSVSSDVDGGLSAIQPDSGSDHRSASPGALPAQRDHHGSTLEQPASDAESDDKPNDSKDADEESGDDDDQTAEKTQYIGGLDHKKKRKKQRRGFGIRHNVQNTQYINPDDYDQKYPPDELFKGLDDNARVWKVYLDEAKMMDDDMVEAWKDTIDVLLVFAGLFSAVVTTFVIQSSQSLQQDSSQVSAMLLTELVGLQRAIASGISVNTVPMAAQNATSSFEAARSDQWVNRLWFTSLAFSLATALMAVLVKQWLQYYVSPISGTGREKAHVRHFRFSGIEKWHVSGIVGSLPILMHIALLLFLIGLVLFLMSLDKASAGIIGFLAALLYLIYIGTNVLPVFFMECPYKTPISDLMASVKHLVLYLFYQAKRSYLYHSSEDDELILDNIENAVIAEREAIWKSQKESESLLVKDQEYVLDMESLGWLNYFSSNTSVAWVLFQAVSSIDIIQHTMKSFRLQIVDHWLPLFEKFSSIYKQKYRDGYQEVEWFFWSHMILAVQANSAIIFFGDKLDLPLPPHLEWYKRVDDDPEYDLITLLGKQLGLGSQAYYNALAFVLMFSATMRDGRDNVLRLLAKCIADAENEPDYGKLITVFGIYSSANEEDKTMADTNDTNTMTNLVLKYYSQNVDWLSKYSEDEQDSVIAIAEFGLTDWDTRDSAFIFVASQLSSSWSLYTSTTSLSILFSIFDLFCKNHAMYMHIPHLENIVDWDALVKGWASCMQSKFSDPDMDNLEEVSQSICSIIEHLIFSEIEKTIVAILNKYQVLSTVNNVLKHHIKHNGYTTSEVYDITHIFNDVLDSEHLNDDTIKFLGQSDNIRIYLSAVKAFLIGASYDTNTEDIAVSIAIYMEHMWFNTFRQIHILQNSKRDEAAWSTFLDQALQWVQTDTLSMESWSHQKTAFVYYHHTFILELIKTVRGKVSLAEEKSLTRIPPTSLENFMRKLDGSGLAEHFSKLEELLGTIRLFPKSLGNLGSWDSIISEHAGRLAGSSERKYRWQSLCGKSESRDASDAV